VTVVPPTAGYGPLVPGGFPPPPSPPARVLPTQAFTPWSKRLLAFFIDWTPIWLVFVVPMIGLPITDGAECFDAMYGAGHNYCTTTTSGLWMSVQVFGLVPAAVYFFWNFCYRQGKSGQSIGKSVLKFKVVSEKTWQPIGFWPSLARQLAHYVDQLICYIGYLWPLWDDKRQTLADMIMSTVCVPVTTTASLEVGVR
jgi:uncharacterized RDD family membrane protein YckC